MSNIRTAPVLKMPDLSKITDKATRDAIEQIVRFQFDNQSNIHDDLIDTVGAIPTVPTKATQAVAEAASNDTDFMTPLQVKNEVQKASAVSIPDSNLAQISTASKVKGEALTSLANIPSGAGVIPSANLPAVVSIPSGVICMWKGTIATIPSGWVLCDGNNSTPDLRNRFIVGADADVSSVAKSTVTGTALQTSDGVIPAHTHTVGGSFMNTQAYDNNVTALQPSGSINTGSYGTGTKNIAVFYALAYIMKT